jgi:hypothetical protein
LSSFVPAFQNILQLLNSAYRRSSMDHARYLSTSIWILRRHDHQYRLHLPAS